MIPVSDTAPDQPGRPIVTIALIGAFAAVFLFSLTQTPLERDQTLFRYTAIPCELDRGRPLVMAEINRLAVFDETEACGHEVTAGDEAIHAGLDREVAVDEPFAPAKRQWLAVPLSLLFHFGWLHLLLNAWGLWLFGDNVELRIGRIAYVALVVGAGIVGVVAQTLSSPDSLVPVIGSGGIASGALGCYVVLYPDNRLKVLTLGGSRELAVGNFALWWFGVQTLFALGPVPASWIVPFAGFAVGCMVGLAVRAVPFVRARVAS